MYKILNFLYLYQRKIGGPCPSVGGNERCLQGGPDGPANDHFFRGNSFFFLFESLHSAKRRSDSEMRRAGKTATFLQTLSDLLGQFYQTFYCRNLHIFSVCPWQLLASKARSLPERKSAWMARESWQGQPLQHIWPFVEENVVLHSRLGPSGAGQENISMP